MKILATAYDFLPNVGGISNCAESILSALVEKGDDIRLITRADAPPMSFPIIPIKHHKSTLIAALKTVRALFREVKRDRPDAIFHFLWWPEAISSLLLSIFSKNPVPYFIMIHGKEIFEKRDSLKSRIRHFLKEIVFSRASGVVCVSDFTATITINKINSIQSKIKTIYHGVDTKYYSPQKTPDVIRKKYGLEGKKIFLTVARLESYKGIDYGILALKRAIKINPSLAYVVVGVGIDYDRLQQMIIQEGLQKHVILAGKVPFSELPNYYRMADCFLLLTRNRFDEPNYEGFGISILEAAACAKPSLVGENSGMLEAIQYGKMGWAVNPDNIEEIEKAMILIMGDEVELMNRGKIAREMTEKYFNWDRTADELTQFIEKEINVCVV